MDPNYDIVHDRLSLYLLHLIGCSCVGVFTAAEGPVNKTVVDGLLDLSAIFWADIFGCRGCPYITLDIQSMMILAEMGKMFI